VSLDASNAADYRRDKGVDRFDAVCDGVRLLVAADGKATIGIGYLVTENNFGNAQAAADLAADLGADYVQFRPTIAYAQKNPGALSEDTRWLKRATETLEQVDGNVIVDFRRFHMYENWDGHGYKTCYWSGLQTVVTPNGSIWTCVNKREHPAALLGNLGKESFREIWSRRKLAEVDETCRVMCRGHIPNLALDEMLAPKEHAAFV
jgi:sulfatase maturation enzyme AslB (radical SAM superfamily)